MFVDPELVLPEFMLEAPRDGESVWGIRVEREGDDDKALVSKSIPEEVPLRGERPRGVKLLGGELCCVMKKFSYSKFRCSNQTKNIISL